MTSPDPVALSRVLAFVAGHADGDALDTIIDAVRNRRRALSDIAATAVTVGAVVRLHSLSPRYLNGLTGTVIDIPTPRRGAKRRCTVRLDQTSVAQLAEADAQYAHLGDSTSFDLGGIPVSACQLLTPLTRYERNVSMKLSKVDATLHQQVCDLVALDRPLRDVEQEFVLPGTGRNRRTPPPSPRWRGRFSPRWTWHATSPSRSRGFGSSISAPGSAPCPGPCAAT